MKKIFCFLLIISSIVTNAQTSTMIQGTGTINRIPKFTGSKKIGNSQIIDNGKIGINTLTPAATLHVAGTGIFTDSLVITTMGAGDSSARAASTAFVKRRVKSLTLQDVTDVNERTTRPVTSYNISVNKETYATLLADAGSGILRLEKAEGAGLGVITTADIRMDNVLDNNVYQLPNRSGTIALIENVSDSVQWRLQGANIHNKNSGNVGVGTNAPTAKLEVAGLKTLLSTDTVAFKTKKYTTGFEGMEVNFYRTSDNNLNFGFLLHYLSTYSNDLDNNDVKGASLFGITQRNSIGQIFSLLVERRNLNTYPDTTVIHVNPTGGFGGGYSTGFPIRMRFKPSGVGISSLLFNAYLKDTYLNTTTLLNRSDTTAYTFTMDANPASYGNRFQVIYTSENLGLSKIIMNVDSSVSPNNILTLDENNIVRKASIGSGANGTNGAAWFDGEDAPLSTIGVNGDFYLKRPEGNVYKKIAGSWVFNINLLGPAGAPGTNGLDGNTGPQGIQGIQGIQGLQGLQGLQGNPTNLIYNEEFTGSTSSTYTLSNTPVIGKIIIFKNGVKLLNSQFSISGALVTLVGARLTADVFSNDYQY